MKHSTLFLFVLLSGLSMPLAWAESGLVKPVEPGVFDTSSVMTDDALSDQRGGTLVSNTNEQNAGLYDNSASDVVTGGNLVSDGSLTNNNGFNTVIQNSGNNVLIQNSLILNLQMQ